MHGKEQTLVAETARIKEIYEKNVNNTDDVYATLEEKNFNVNNLKVGDYVIYDSGTNGNVTCIVLYEANSPYGLQIISDKSVKEVTIDVSNDFETAKTEYNKAIETLNKEALKYKNHIYATDVRCVGSNPVNKNAEVLGPVTMQFEYNGSTDIDYKNEDTNYETDQKAMQNIGIWSIGEPYWLASRSIDMTHTYCDVYVRVVSKEGEIRGDYFGGVNSASGHAGSMCHNGLRPCITLKHNEIKITGGDGTKDNPYTLGINNEENLTLASKVSIGDYVAYNVTEGVEDESKLKYESPVGTGMSHGNGHSAQKFTANSNIKWRVLNVDYSSGEVTLISETPLQTDAGQDFYLRGAIGYLYAEQELNEICKIYGYGKGANTAKTFEYETGDVVEGLDKGTITGSGARSINAEDINKITGFERRTYKDQFGAYGDTYTHTVYYPTKTTPTGQSDIKTTRTDIQTFYAYTGVDYLKDVTSNIYKLLFMNITNQKNISYWLASRNVLPSSNSTSFFIRCIGNGGVSWQRNTNWK